MSISKGLYVGDRMVMSHYDDVTKGFTDEECHAQLDHFDGIKYTTDRNIENNRCEKVDEAISLAYRSHNELVKRGLSQDRIFEIVCKNNKAFFYTVIGTNSNTPLVEYEKSIDVVSAEDVDMYILEYLELVVGSAETGNTCILDLIDAYKSALMQGQKEKLKCTDFKQIDVFLNEIKGNKTRKDISFGEIAVNIEELKEGLLQELSSEFVTSIGILVHELTVNFSTNDIVFVYSDVSLDKVRKNDFSVIEEKNHVKIANLERRDIAIARGNAYYDYLKKYEFVNKIKKNTGRFCLLYNEEQFKLDGGEGCFEIVINNDFQIFPIFEIYDVERDKSIEARLLIPFFKTGDLVNVSYKYDVGTLDITIRHMLSNIECNKTIKI